MEVGAAGAVTSFADVTDLDAGFGGALRLGFWLPLNLGIELEGLTSSPKSAAGSSTSVLSGTASLLYNIRTGESSSFFLKGGLGTTKYGDTCPTVSVPGAGPCGSASDFVLGAGFRAAVSPIIMIRGEADYQHNSDVTSFSNLVGSLGVAVMADQPSAHRHRPGRRVRPQGQVPRHAGRRDRQQEGLPLRHRQGRRARRTRSLPRHAARRHRQHRRLPERHRQGRRGRRGGSVQRHRRRRPGGPDRLPHRRRRRRRARRPRSLSRHARRRHGGRARLPERRRQRPGAGRRRPVPDVTRGCNG